MIPLESWNIVNTEELGNPSWIEKILKLFCCENREVLIRQNKSKQVMVKWRFIFSLISHHSRA
ncbi:MAG: hypothetical protein AMS27_04050 [Bacteroides sp. SM23_62_1]|nr:MAG: hypothetical protein AMS27_04050 [Bacteroides sp. SM23_62_1]